jgi:hypothetical protein
VCGLQSAVTPMFRKAATGSDGKIDDAIPLNARSIAISPTTDDFWISTEDAAEKIDRSGHVLATAPHRRKSSQSWMAAF